MPRDPFIREKSTKDRNAARKHAAEYFQRFPKERYQTGVESWRELQSQNIEFAVVVAAEWKANHDAEVLERVAHPQTDDQEEQDATPAIGRRTMQQSE